MSKNKPLSREEFKEVYSRVPRLAIELVIKTNDGIVLTLRKGGNGWENMWHLPGMTLLYKERIPDAIQRVAQEEAGVQVNVEKLLGYIEYPSEEKERGFGWTISVVFLCSLLSGELHTNSDASEIRVFTQLPDNLIEEEKTFLNEVLN